MARSDGGHSLKIGGSVAGPVVVGDHAIVDVRQAGGGGTERSAPAAPAAQPPAHRPLLVVDIERSAGRGAAAQEAIRKALLSLLRASFNESGIDWERCRVDDLGDGFRVAAPGDTPKSRMVYPLLQDLANRLRAHNVQSRPLTQIRLRVALHAGDVAIDDMGTATGRPLEILARLLDAAPLRTALAQAPESVPAAALLSRHFYEETVPNGYPGIDPAAFQRVDFTTKEYSADAWLHIPRA
ncbi:MULTISPECIES: hypothetical protein [unclassified Actinomadura]|uniref:hypothetical protein n=1 Tax=unclassified Actinomadura TaxID=2626254 RepID=UPI0011F032A7|nr:hypothetical protein [Actinomadura sp. K4S16]